MLTDHTPRTPGSKALPIHAYAAIDNASMIANSFPNIFGSEVLPQNLVAILSLDFRFEVGSSKWITCAYKEHCLQP